MRENYDLSEQNNAIAIIKMKIKKKDIKYVETNRS